jgi:ABC-type sugar transport system permease subunit
MKKETVMQVATRTATGEGGKGSMVMPSKWARWRRRHRHALLAWIILTPILIYYTIFAIMPVLLNLIVSFTNWDGFSEIHWIGLRNYIDYFTTPSYLTILGVTALFTIGGLVLSIPLSFFAALLLNQKVFGRGLHRALWYIPTLTSAAVMAQVGQLVVAPYGGILNLFRQSIGLAPIIWTIDSNFMRIFIIVFSMWRGVGGTIILFLAGLQGISTELYEAARVDGASGWNVLRYITIPLLRPMFVFILVTGVIAGFQIFEAVFLISGGGPKGQTNVMLVQIYNDAFANFNFGMASTGATIMMLLLLGFSIMNMRILQRG